MAKYTCQYAEKYSVDPVLMLAIQKHESNYRHRAVSRTKDCGLMQINDPDGDCFKGCDLRKIHCNIWYGARFLYRTRTNCIRRHDHKYWIRHYNWGSKYHYWRILWLTRAFKEAFFEHSPNIYKAIKNRSYPKKFPECIVRHDLCLT